MYMYMYICIYTYVYKPRWARRCTCRPRSCTGRATTSSQTSGRSDVCCMSLPRLSRRLRCVYIRI